MEAEVAKYAGYKRDLQFMLISSGLWSNYEKHPRILRNVLSLCSGFLNGAVSLGILTFCITYATNMNLLSRGLGLLVSFSSVFLKVCILSFHRDDLQSLNDGVTSQFERDLKVPENRPHLLVHFRRFSRFFYSFSYTVGVIVVIFTVIPLSQARQGNYVRMYPQVFFFAYEAGGTIHWIIFFCEVIAGYFLWAVTCGVDSYFGYYCFHLVGELRLVSHRFRNLRSSKEYVKDLKECVDRHVELIKAWHLLERIFGFLSIWLAITCAVVLCTISFQATESKRLPVLKVCYLICYGFFKLTQAYSYAWFGNVISTESKLCLDSMFNACWPESGDIRFMNDVLIVLSQRPFVFIAKSVMLLEMEMFHKILNTSVSYFFLLRTLEESLDEEST